LESLVSQIYAFAVTLIAGMAAGFCYDYYRVVRRVLRLKKAGTCVGDIIFWLFTTALVFFLLLLGNWGIVRIYVFIGIGLGALIYFRLFSNTMSRLIRFKFYLFQKIWELTVKLALFIWRVVLFPFHVVILILSYPLGFFSYVLKKAGRKTKFFFYRLVGWRVERGAAKVKSALLCLAFWKKKKE